MNAGIRRAWVMGMAAAAIGLAGGRAAAQSESINFDDQNEPCNFAQTSPLRDRYSGQGVAFAGPGNLDGGAILDQCGNFGVPARSGENFLAFNRNARMNNGGVPRDPETLNFSRPASQVSIWVAGGIGDGNFRMEAFNSGGQLIAQEEVRTRDWAELKVIAGGIARVVITETGVAQHQFFVMDDLTFNLGEACSRQAKLIGKCKRKDCGNRMQATLKKGPPDEIVTFRLNGGNDQPARVNNNGKAKASWCPVAGGLQRIEVVECQLGKAVQCPLLPDPGPGPDPGQPHPGLASPTMMRPSSVRSITPSSGPQIVGGMVIDGH